MTKKLKQQNLKIKDLIKINNLWVSHGTIKKAKRPPTELGENIWEIMYPIRV